MIRVKSYHCMEYRSPFKVRGVEYDSAWQWVACDKAISVSDVSGYTLLLKLKPSECRTLVNHIYAPEWDLFTALKEVARHRRLYVKSAVYMVEDREVGAGVTPEQLEHGLHPTGLNLWGRALSTLQVAELPPDPQQPTTLPKSTRLSEPRKRTT